MITVIARNQVLSLRRQRIFAVMLITILAMTVLAGVIGWSSHATIVRIYNDAVKLLASSGQPAPPNPFALKPPLSLLSNMAIYVPLIGALLALLLGHVSLADDETNGLGRLIFSRQVSRSSYVLGKVVAAAAVLAVILAASLLVSVAAVRLVNGSGPSLTQIGQLALFYALSWLYLMFFALIGMVAMLVTRRRSLALLGAMGVWLVLTFVVPQFTSGLRPVSSLNPVTNPVSTSQTFFRVTAKARPVSVTEQYKEASARILGTAQAEPTVDTVVRILPIVVATAAMGLLAAFLVRRRDYSRSITSE